MSDSQERSGFSAEQLRRAAGGALVAALPLQVVGFALHPAGEQLQHVVQGRYGPAHLVLFGSWLLALLGLPALYEVQASRAGRLGLLAFVGTVCAAAYHLYLTLFEAAAVPVAAAQPGAGTLVGEDGVLAHGAGALGPLALVLLLAFPALGVATLRAGVLPRAAGWLQVACLPAFVALMLAVAAATGGVVGPDADSWPAGMLPIASLYWVLFAGWAVAGWAMRNGVAPAGRGAAAERHPVAADHA